MIDEILDVGIALSKEKNREALLDKILNTAMAITNCDGGTLYLAKEEELEFHIMITKSQKLHNGGTGHEFVSWLPVKITEQNVCASAIRQRELIRIDDVYENQEYDFARSRKYDEIHNYHTTSLMVVPMEDDKGEIIGVMQLVNALNEKGDVIPFQPEYDKVILALGSQAAICLKNMTYARQIENMLDSFIEVMSIAIDARTPYNVNHTKNMVKYAQKFVSWINQREEIDWEFTEEQLRIFLISIWLHDIGKLTTPLKIMNKRTRLGFNEQIVMQRLEKIGLLYRIYELEGKVTSGEARDVEARIEYVKELIMKVQQVVGILPDALEEKVQGIQDYEYIELNGEHKTWLTEEEFEQLCIKKGNLTAEERSIMQEHVTMSAQMLEHMNLQGEYKNIVIWASQHHEFVNGTGYPNQLVGDEICREVRLMTILDVYEALTTKDRPYKAAMTSEEALEVLRKMRDDGEIDGQILDWFIESYAWEC